MPVFYVESVKEHAKTRLRWTFRIGHEGGGSED